MVWLRALGLLLPIAATSSLEKTRYKGKIEFYTSAWQPVVVVMIVASLSDSLCSVSQGVKE